MFIQSSEYVPRGCEVNHDCCQILEREEDLQKVQMELHTTLEQLQTSERKLHKLQVDLSNAREERCIANDEVRRFVKGECVLRDC